MRDGHLKIAICMGTVWNSNIGKSNTNNLPAPTDLIKNLYGKKTLFFKMQLKNRPPWF
jgi:hypothetical protein